MFSGPRYEREIDQAYQDGIADTCEKILNLIFASDGELTIQELSDFLEAELYRDVDDTEEVVNV